MYNLVSIAASNRVLGLKPLIRDETVARRDQFGVEDVARIRCGVPNRADIHKKMMGESKCALQMPVTVAPAMYFT